MTDFDNPKDEVKKAVRHVKYSMPYTAFDEKYYSCLRSDLQKAIFVQFSSKLFEGGKSEHEVASKPSKSEAPSEINLHENRDRLKSGI